NWAVRQQDGQLQPAAPQRRRLPPRLLNGGLMNDHPTPLGGTCSARFDPLRELFAAKLRPATPAPPAVGSWSVPTSPHRPEGPMRHVTACLTVVSLAGALAARAQDAPAKPLAITGVTVIDATGAPARSDMTVVVTGDRITAVGKSGEVGVP